MNPEEENSELEATDGLTSDDLASIAVDPSQAPVLEPVVAQESGPLGAFVAVVVLMLGLGKKLETVLKVQHEERMKEIAESASINALETEAVLQQELDVVAELKTSLEKDLAVAKEAPPCACADNRVAIDELAARLKRLENWKKRGVRSSKSS